MVYSRRAGQSVMLMTMILISGASHGTSPRIDGRLRFHSICGRRRNPNSLIRLFNSIQRCMRQVVIINWNERQYGFGINII